MPELSRPGNRPGFLLVIIVAMLVVTWIGVSLSTATRVTLGPPEQTAQTFSVDEAAYYEFVAPRLERLVQETDSVLELVKNRSRNVFSLNVHGNRINRLAAEIKAFGETHPVPERFAAIHKQIIEGSEYATIAISDAESALQRFDFSDIPHLIPQFEDGSRLLHQSWDGLRVIANATPEA
jgi:hypothetical protein